MGTIHPTDTVTGGRQLTTLDRLLAGVGRALEASFGSNPPATRPSPARAPEFDGSEPERGHAAGLMRVNHSGEVCAQALYVGQAITCDNPLTRDKLDQAAREELDHLAWCAARLEELASHPSRLNPLWYAGSFAMGVTAGLMGERWNLGFLRETERQVEAHLQTHLDRLPAADERSREIVRQMKVDEAEHAAMAGESGAAELPPPVRRAMRFTAGVMKTLAYRI